MTRTAPDALVERSADVILFIAENAEDEGDRMYFASTNDPHTLTRQARYLYKAADTMTALIAERDALREFLTDARERLPDHYTSDAILIASIDAILAAPPLADKGMAMPTARAADR